VGVIAHDFILGFWQTWHMLKDDAYWPRAATWLQPQDGTSSDLALVGIPAHKTSISSTGANHTPAAIREALQRYSLESSIGSLESIKAVDAGDLLEPDEAEETSIAFLAEFQRRSRLVVSLGGDNSITYAAALGSFGDQISSAGLITFDAHHDIRDGRSNGSPVRRLIEERGLAGSRVVQIGINDFSNSPHYAARARQLGIHVIHRDEIEKRGVDEVVAEALAIAGAAGGPIHVDVDVDVCDRAFVPACPASAPGGISPFQLRKMVSMVTASSLVRSLDITEIDATADAADQRTVRLGALLILEAAKGLLARR
jgi:formiminoglutamase